MTRYGYIGLGSMGGAMVGHLLGTGAQVRVFDLDPDAVHRCEVSGDQRVPWTHVRFNIDPDGGVSRLRIYGRPADPGPAR